jgi:3-oxoacyl-[acyl-carrier protein] reductase
MEGDLRGHVALVTGASRGIGAAIATSLAHAGAAVAINYRERADKADALASELAQAGHRAITIRCDVSKAVEVAQMVRRVEAELGAVDILVNNAGIALRRSIDELSEEDFDQTIAVNLKSAFLCMKAVLPGMQSRGWGRIINITSGAARSAGSIGPHYNASKAGMEGLTRGYAARLAASGITVNNVAPSLIATDMMEGQAELVSRIPMGRFGTPEEVSGIVAFLLSDRAGYITGASIDVAGGMGKYV